MKCDFEESYWDLGGIRGCGEFQKFEEMPELWESILACDF